MCGQAGSEAKRVSGVAAAGLIAATDSAAAGTWHLLLLASSHHVSAHPTALLVCNTQIVCVTCVLPLPPGVRVRGVPGVLAEGHPGAGVPGADDVPAEAAHAGLAGAADRERAVQRVRAQEHLGQCAEPPAHVTACGGSALPGADTCLADVCAGAASSRRSTAWTQLLEAAAGQKLTQLVVVWLHEKLDCALGVCISGVFLYPAVQEGASVQRISFCMLLAGLQRLDSGSSSSNC